MFLSKNFKLLSRLKQVLSCELLTWLRCRCCRVESNVTSVDFSLQRTSGHRERRGRLRGRAQQPRQGEVPSQRCPKVAGDHLRVGQLQDGALQEASEALQAGIRLPPIPQQQRQTQKSKEIQIQVKKVTLYQS